MAGLCHLSVVNRELLEGPPDQNAESLPIEGQSGPKLNRAKQTLPPMARFQACEARYWRNGRDQKVLNRDQ
jgi:hypothetical protein